MLTRLIANLYAGIIEISLWIVLLISGVVGYRYTVPILESAGLILDDASAWSICGALVFLVLALPMLALLTGPLLVLIDIRKSLKIIEARSSEHHMEVPSSDLGEPLPFLWEDSQHNPPSDASQAARHQA